MIIILDSNVIIAALIKDSITRKIIIDLHPHIYFPEEMSKEIKKYKDIIKKKAKINEQQFLEAYQKLFKYIKTVPNDDILKYKEKAQRIMQEIDPKDHLLIAASFCFPDSVIWSNDPHLKMQTKVNTFTTLEIIKKIKMFLEK